MANHKNLSTPFIYLRSTGENISVTKEQRDAFYKEADRIRHKEQHHHRCMCSKKTSLGMRWRLHRMQISCSRRYAFTRHSYRRR